MIAKINGTTIYFDIDGPGLIPAGNEMIEKPAMLAIHGGPGFDHTGFKSLLPRLADFLQIIYVDLRGNGRSGRSTPQEYTIEKTVEDLEALRKYLGLDKIIVFGTSYGGMVALSYATTHPEKVMRLIIARTAPSFEWFNEGKREAYRKASSEMKYELDVLFDAGYESPEQMRKSFSILMPLYTHTKYDPLGTEDGLDHTIFSPDAINWGFGVEIKHNYDVRDKLKLITAPTLIIAGRHDWAMLPHQQEFMHKNISDSQLVWFENCGHSMSDEEPDAFIQIIREFLRDFVDKACGIRRISSLL